VLDQVRQRHTYPPSGCRGPAAPTPDNPGSECRGKQYGDDDDRAKRSSANPKGRGFDRKASIIVMILGLSVAGNIFQAIHWMMAPDGPSPAGWNVLYSMVDPARAIAVCRRGLEVATRIGDLGFQARLYTNLAVACCTFTDRCGEEGVPAAEKAIEIDRALDQREHLAVPLTVLAQIHQCHHAPELALRYYHEALEVARETGEPQLLFPCYDGLATLCLDRDDMEEAERYFGLAQELCDRHGLDPGTLIVLPFLD
jgi:hypothetical protein